MSEYPCLDISNSTASSEVFVLPEILALKEEVIANRRWFHANPELSFQEVKTAERIVEHLRSYGIEEIIEGVGRTGVVALIRGTANSNAKPICVALRADIDALPITETADIEYVSKNNGVMHACGHDGHMAGLLAAAKVLHNERHTFSGIVKLLFQPAEEGFHGAREMINDGCLEEGRLGPRVDEIYGIHIWTVNKLGDVCCEVGPVMAASDRFCIEVRGAGGHGAAPQYTVDAIVEAATVVTSLQTIVSRSMDPLESAVLTCGTIQGGYGYNIVADHVRIGGTCRTFTKDNQEKMKRRMKEVCCGVAHMYGGDISLDYEYGYPPTINSYPECNEVVSKAAARFVGNERSRLPQKTMGAEDFSYFLQERPGCFFFVGAALPGVERPHHKSVFDFDERGVFVAASIFVQIIRDKMQAQV
jgi:amidohydrolase